MSADTAAWVSAGAAVVQAIGAVAAIWASVKLARDSASREREANAAAEARAVAAERAADERAKEADEAADRRIQRVRAEARNSIIDRVVALANVAIDELGARLESDSLTLSYNTGTISGRLYGPTWTELKDIIPSLKNETSDTDLLLELSKLTEIMSHVDYSGEGYESYRLARDGVIGRFRSAIDKVGVTQSRLGCFLPSGSRRSAQGAVSLR